MLHVHRTTDRQSARPLPGRGRARLRAIALSVVLVGAVPALALAASHDYGGKLGPPGANIELTLAKPKHAARKVTHFEWNNVPTQCGSSGTSATTGDFHKKMTVKDGSFHRTVQLNSGRETVIVHGTFTDKWENAHGTLHVTGPIAGCSKSDTGVVAWTVHRH